MYSLSNFQIEKALKRVRKHEKVLQQVSLRVPVWFIGMGSQRISSPCNSCWCDNLEGVWTHLGISSRENGPAGEISIAKNTLDCFQQLCMFLLPPSPCTYFTFCCYCQFVTVFAQVALELDEEQKAVS